MVIVSLLLSAFVYLAQMREEIVSGFSQFIKFKDYGKEIKVCRVSETRSVHSNFSSHAIHVSLSRRSVS